MATAQIQADGARLGIQVVTDSKELPLAQLRGLRGVDFVLRLVGRVVEAAELDFENPNISMQTMLIILPPLYDPLPLIPVHSDLLLLT